MPIPEAKPLSLATDLDRLGQERQANLPAQLVDRLPMTRAELDLHRAEAERLLRRMIALQEELDWRCYTLYGITDQDLCYRDPEGNALDPPQVDLGQRAFEIAVARQMAGGELSSTWFERHRSKSTTPRWSSGKAGRRSA